MTFKYIIVTDRFGMELPILFSQSLAHADFKGAYTNIVSAGFGSINEIKKVDGMYDIYMEPQVTCWGQSVTLQMKSRKEIDADIIRIGLRK